MKEKMPSRTPNIFFIMPLAILLTGCGLRVGKIHLDEITNPTALYMHRGLFYAVDEGAAIHVYDAKNFRLLHTFGERGEGPGQFHLRPAHSVSLHFMEDRILINSDGKISYFSYDGRFLSEKETPRHTLRYRPLGDDRFVYRGHAQDADTLYFTYMLCDTAFHDIREITREKNDYQPAGPTIDVFAVSWDFYTFGDRIYIHHRSKGQIIDVYDRNGIPIQSLWDEYEPLRVEQRHIDGVHEGYRTSPYSKDAYGKWLRDALRFPEYFPAVRAWTVAEEKVYIFSFRQIDGKSQLRIYNADGSFIKEIHVELIQKETDIDRVSPFAVSDRKLYQFVHGRKGRRVLRSIVLK